VCAKCRVLKSGGNIVHHNSAVCLTTGPYPLPKWVLHRLWPSDSTLNFQSGFLKAGDKGVPSSCLLLHPRLPIPHNFPLITYLEGRSYARFDRPILLFYYHFFLSDLCPSKWTRGGQLDELEGPHFRKQIWQEPYINKIKYSALFNGFLFQFIQLQYVSFSLLSL
jgi:hypothetical protein